VSAKSKTARAIGSSILTIDSACEQTTRPVGDLTQVGLDVPTGQMAPRMEQNTSGASIADSAPW
jgi:hypothetical protein